MERNEKIQYISTIVLFGFAVSVIYHYIMGAYWGFGFPQNTFLFTPDDKFMDFLNAFTMSEGMNPYLGAEPMPTRIWFPFTYLITFLFSLIKSKPIALSVFILSFIIFWLLYIYKNFKQKNAVDTYRDCFILSFLAYPFLITVDRSNLEAYIFILLCAFTHSYLISHIRKSIVFLAFAISMKPFPLVFLIIFLAGKKYKYFFLTVALALAITFISLLLFRGTLTANISRLLVNLNLYNLNYAIGSGGWAYGHSFFGVVKVLVVSLILALEKLKFNFNAPLNQVFITSIIMSYKFYILISGLIFLGVTIYIVFVEKVFWKSIALLVFAMNLLPYVSADYKLLHLFIPLGLFVNYKEKDEMDWLYSSLFSLLLIPKNYFIVPTMTSLGLSAGVVLNPIIMALLSFFIMNYGVRDNMKKSEL